MLYIEKMFTIEMGMGVKRPESLELDEKNRQTDKQSILRVKRLNDLIYRNQIVCGILHGPMHG